MRSLIVTLSAFLALTYTSNLLAQEKSSEIKAKFEKEGLKVGDAAVKIPDAVYTALEKAGDSEKEFEKLGIKVDKEGKPTVKQKTFGKEVLNSDGAIGFLPTASGAEIIVCPSGSNGVGTKNKALKAVYFPVENGKFGTPVLITPAASELYAGFYTYHQPGTTGFVVFVK